MLDEMQQREIKQIINQKTELNEEEELNDLLL
jgi:hypothetical protein